MILQIWPFPTPSTGWVESGESSPKTTSQSDSTANKVQEVPKNNQKRKSKMWQKNLKVTHKDQSWLKEPKMEHKKAYDSQKNVQIGQKA